MSRSVQVNEQRKFHIRRNATGYLSDKEKDYNPPANALEITRAKPTMMTPLHTAYTRSSLLPVPETEVLSAGPTVLAVVVIAVNAPRVGMVPGGVESPVNERELADVCTLASLPQVVVILCLVSL